MFIGLLAASYSLMQFLSAPSLGRLSDERGRRPVLMLSLAGSTVAWLVFGMTGEFRQFGVVAAMSLLFTSRMLAGAMGGNIAAAQAYVADVTPPEQRAGALGLLGASFALGFVFGPALGGIFASDAAVAVSRGILPAFLPATPYSLPSFAAAGLSFLALCLAAVFLREPARTRGPSARTTLVQGSLRALRDPSLRGLVLAFFLASLAFSGVQVMFIPFAADVYGYGETQTALLLTYVGVLGVVNQGVVVGRLTRRFSPARVAVGGASGLVVALAFLPFAPVVGRALLPAFSAPVPAFDLTPELAALLAVLALLSVGNGLLNVSLSTLVSLAASGDRQGSAFGVTQGAASLGRTVGPPLMALGYVGARALPFVAGAALVVPVIALLGRKWGERAP